MVKNAVSSFLSFTSQLNMFMVVWCFGSGRDSLIESQRSMSHSTQILPDSAFSLSSSETWTITELFIMIEYRHREWIEPL